MNPTKMAFTNRRYLDVLEERGILFDGATGTELRKQGPTVEDYGGPSTEGLGEMLLLYRPEIVEQVHYRYYAAGADAVETDTLRGSRLALREFGVEHLVMEVNRVAGVVARRAADRATAEDGRERFVAGSMGPTGRLPSLDDPELSNVTFDELVEVFAEQTEGLLVGGVDSLLLETQQDLLEVKAAVAGIWRAFEKLGVRIPVQVQVTLDASGHMLTGPDIEAVMVALAPLPVDVWGLNCSTGPEEMRDSVRRLLALSNRPVAIQPNAGMPHNEGGKAVYDLHPGPFAAALAEFASWGVQAVGGCCGTGPEHIAALHEALKSVTRPVGLRTELKALPYLASNMQMTSLHQEPRPLLIGERINTQGSKQARELILNERYDAIRSLADEQVGYGAHVLDLCVALTERADEAATMQKITKLLQLSSPAPLAFDTTDPAVMRAALSVYPGRAVINSVNLEGGEARARQILELAREFGAAVVALTIDEQGMAKSVERKLAVARRIYELAVDEIGLPPHALIFDPLTFTLATGDPETAQAAVDTLESLRRIKTELPGVLTNLGVSNVSYGLKPGARRILNSVLLYRAVEAGLDVAIVNPAQITPYADLPAEERELAEDLLFNRRPDALARFVTHFESAAQTAAATTAAAAALPVEERLQQAILLRRREGVEALVDSCLEHHPALSVLNEILLPAMKIVGDRFGAGELILPFVLQSAEVMKAAVSHLEQYLERGADSPKGTIVLATVFGDVHDIGKNLVKTILANNGYTVHDLGKQVPVETVLSKAEEVNADAIGLSALLVATSKQMQVAVEELRRRGANTPLLIGGAAINADFAQRIAVDYAGGVHYCKDAFDALRVLEQLPAGGRAEAPRARAAAVKPAGMVCECELPAPHRPVTAIPQPPFWGVAPVVKASLEELLGYLDRASLFRIGWGAKDAQGARWEAVRVEFEARLASMWPTAGDYLQPEGLYGFFPVQSQGNDLLIYDPAAPEARREIARFTFPRQSTARCLCLTDYFASVESGVLDVLPLQVATVGSGATQRFGSLDAQGEYSEAYFVHGLAAQAAEAMAALLHARVRKELGLPDGQGKRYSWGYPSCPDLEGHRTLFSLLPIETALRVSLTSAAQLTPEHSTAAMVVHHPGAVYFGVH